MNGRKNLNYTSGGDPRYPGSYRYGREAMFTVSIPDEGDAELLLYRDGEEEPCAVLPLSEKERIGQVNTIRVLLEDDADYTYVYRTKSGLLIDPYAKELRPCPDGIRAVLEPGWTVCESFLSHPYEDSIIYKLHVRGFTMQRKPAVRFPGTFAGLAESIPYLQEFGVNTVLLMPVYAFTEINERAGGYMLDGKLLVKGAADRRRNYWGYTDGFYFSPRPSYSATGHPAKEFADLVAALHDAGISCLLEFYFRNNESARLVTDVLRHWMLLYHVDGFHLVGDGPWSDAVRSDPILKKSKLLVLHADEQLTAPATPPRRREIAVYDQAFRGVMRRFLKGDLDIPVEDVTGMLRRNAATFAYVQNMADQDGFTLADLVSYDEKHNEANGEDNRDGMSSSDSWNCGEEGPTRKVTVRRLREKQLRNALLLLLTAQGTPVLYAGDEEMNTQEGNNNAWCQDNSIGWLTWQTTKSAAQLRDFVRKAIAFRRAHPVLRRAEPLRMADYRSLGFPDISYHSGTAWMMQSPHMRASAGVLYCGGYAECEDGKKDETLYILYNFYWKEQYFALPDAPEGKKWVLAVDTEEQDSFFSEGKALSETETEKREIRVSPRSIRILIAK